MESDLGKKDRRQLAQLCKAISNFSNSRITRKILATEIDVNQRILIDPSKSTQQSCFSTPLHLAATKTSVANFEALLGHGADVTIKDSEGLTALHRLVRDCLSEDKEEPPDSRFISSVLLAHISSGNPSNPADEHGFTHFHVACLMNDVDAVNFFLDKGASVNLAVHHISPLFPGFTPLHFAARFAGAHTAKELLERGANAALRDARGMSPVHVLVERKIALLELLEAKEKLENDESVRAVHQQIHENEKILLLLLDSNTDDESFASATGMSGCHVACTLQKSTMAARYLERIADVDARVAPDAKKWPGYSMLHFAAHCNVGTMKLLLDRGANVLSEDSNGVRPFDICVKWCKPRDVHSIMSMISPWENITFSDGKTKLLDCIAAMGKLGHFRSFLDSNVADANIFLPADSPVWPGSTLLHLSVIFAERFATKGEHSKAIQSLAPEEINSDIVKACLDFGTSIASRDVYGRTPLHLAFRSDKSRVTDMLLQSLRGSLSLADNENLSHLHVACAMRKQWLFEDWLAADANVNVVYTGSVPLHNVQPGWTPLHAAVFSNADCSVIEALMNRGADPHRVDANGLTPIHLLLVSPQVEPKLAKLLLSLADLPDKGYLHVASYFNCTETIDRLLDRGADIDARSSLPGFDDGTALHLAMMNKSMAAVDVLVRRGADVLATRSNGSTPLSKALTSSRYGRSLNTFVARLRGDETLRGRVQAEFGLTVLHVVCRAGHVDAIRDLLGKGADVNARMRGDSPFWPGWTPLHVLVAMGIEVVFQKTQLNDFKTMLEMLLQHGAQVTATNTDRDTPLHLMLQKYPCNTGYYIMTSLLSHQRDFSDNPINRNGVTHFHAACLANNLDAAEKFLVHSAIDVNQPIDYFADHYAGSTPLHLALNSNSKRYFGLETHLRMVDLLLKRRPDLRAEDDHAYTPLHVAADCDPSCLSLLEKLIDNGADMHARTIDGKTAFEMILLSKEITVEEIKFFVKQHYHTNGCNPMTDRGYLSIILNEKNHVLRDEVLKALMNAPTIVATDEIGRTAIHNIVSTDDLVILEHQYVDLIEKLIKLGCDVNEQDEAGMTALHLAALFRNREAITALLMCGGDINIVDSQGKTAFSYIFDRCTHCLARCKTVHDYLLKVFVEHVHKLQLFGLYVSEHNKKMKSLALENRWLRDIRLPNNANVMDVNDKKIKSIVIGPKGWTLQDFLQERGPVNKYHSLAQEDRTMIDQFFENLDYHSFHDLRYMLMIQYRQAVTRGPLIIPAISSIKTLMGLPDLCGEQIVWYLRNPDLKNLIAAADIDEYFSSLHFHSHQNNLLSEII